MKTHDLSDALSDLAKTLKKGPNIDLKNLSISAGNEEFLTAERLDREQLGSALALLASLSKVSRARWIELIKHFGWPIEFDPRDSSRNILGKLITFLQNNPGAQQRLTHSSAPAGTSPALMNALKSLLSEPET